jgi:lipoate synthase
MEAESLPKQNKKTYMKNYMKQRYHANVEKSRAYRNTIRYKARYNLSEEDLKEYKEYLADIYKLRKLKAKLPPELFQKCLESMEG